MFSVTPVKLFAVKKGASGWIIQTGRNDKIWYTLVLQPVGTVFIPVVVLVCPMLQEETMVMHKMKTKAIF